MNTNKLVSLRTACDVNINTTQESWLGVLCYLCWTADETGHDARRYCTPHMTARTHHILSLLFSIVPLPPPSLICHQQMYTQIEWPIFFSFFRGIDILVTHGPPYGLHDMSAGGENFGCKQLLEVVNSIKPRCDSSLIEKGERTEKRGERGEIEKRARMLKWCLVLQISCVWTHTRSIRCNNRRAHDLHQCCNDGRCISADT